MRCFRIGLVCAFVLLAAGPALGDTSPAQLCQSDQLKAAAAQCRANFTCVAKFVKKPQADPDLQKLLQCWSRADSRFIERWRNADARALKRGGSCSLDDSPVDVMNALNLASDEIMILDPPALGADVLSGWLRADKHENKLHSDVLKVAGRYCNKLFKAEARDAKKPDETKRIAARAKELGKFLGKMEKAETRGLGKGWSYLGLPAGSLADALEALVDGLVADSDPPSGGSFQVTGTVLPAAASFVDGDVNDPFAPFTPNDGQDGDTVEPSAADQAAAQLLDVPSSLGGFANQPGAGPPGRSRVSGDISDYYRVSLAAGQVITLQLEPQFGDLDLFLYDQAGSFVDGSNGVSDFETLAVADPGEYIVEVWAAAGGSAYVLTLGQPIPALQGRPRPPRFSDDFVPGELLVTLDARAEEVRARGLAAAAQDFGADLGMSARGGAPDREMLFALAESASARSRTLRGLDRAPKADRGPLRPAPASLDAEGALKFDTLMARKALRGRPDVATADLNHVRRPLFTPDDEFLGFQWHYPLINLPTAWNVTRGASDVVVAVIDTGVLLAHPDLAGQLVAGYDFISNVFNAADGDGIDPNPDDVGDGAGGTPSSFHGTHVAGTVAAATDNALGVAGVAGDARVMPLRVLGINGGTDYDIIQAVRFAARLSNDSNTLPAAAADVINLSLGGPGFNQTSQNTYDLARAEGLIVVAAAGNENSSAPSYPAAYDGVVSVSAVDQNRNRSYYSNFGSRIDVAAPGGDTTVDRDGDGYVDGVLSTLGDDLGDFFYAFYQGTSMAAPHIAGVAALMKSVAPTMLDADSFDALLASGALTDDLGAPGRDDIYGHGLIDAAAAVQAAEDLEDGTPPVLDPVLRVSPGALNFGAVLTSLDVAVSNGGDGSVGTVTASDDRAWLSVAPNAVDGDGIGTWTISVDRSGESDGTYNGTVTFMSTPNDIEVGVVMQVGAAGQSSLGIVYVLLRDPETRATVYQDDVSQEPDGSYPFEFAAVEVGDYLLSAGSDLDNDFALCHTGEACGGYPTLDLQSELRVDGNRSGLDFIAGFQQTVRSGGAGAPMTRDPFAPRRLLPLPDEPDRGLERLESTADQGERAAATRLSSQP